MTEIEKNKIQDLIKVRYNLSDHKVSDINSNILLDGWGAKVKSIYISLVRMRERSLCELLQMVT